MRSLAAITAGVLIALFLIGRFAVTPTDQDSPEVVFVNDSLPGSGRTFEESVGWEIPDPEERSVSVSSAEPSLSSASDIGQEPTADSLPEWAPLIPESERWVFENTLGAFGHWAKRNQYAEEVYTAAWENEPELRQAWAEFQDRKITERVVLDYQDREYVRWNEGTGSRTLFQELPRSILDWIDRETQDPGAVYAAISAYEEEVINGLRKDGSRAFLELDDSPSRWKVVELCLPEAHLAPEVKLVQILKGYL